MRKPSIGTMGVIIFAAVLAFATGGYALDGSAKPLPESSSTPEPLTGSKVGDLATLGIYDAPAPAVDVPGAQLQGEVPSESTSATASSSTNTTSSGTRVNENKKLSGEGNFNTSQGNTSGGSSSGNRSGRSGGSSGGGQQICTMPAMC